uniref:Uncharacterized protein n=1 Tax=Oryza glaberrima TaxID=4538 RepID=I1R2R2_ORYGL
MALSVSILWSLMLAVGLLPLQLDLFNPSLGLSLCILVLLQFATACCILYWGRRLRGDKFPARRTGMGTNVAPLYFTGAATGEFWLHGGGSDVVSSDGEFPVAIPNRDNKGRGMLDCIGLQLDLVTHCRVYCPHV